jgi:hypothetical protein
MFRHNRIFKHPDCMLWDADEADESSGIRPRLEKTALPRSCGAAARDESLADLGERSGRIEQKVRVAALVLEELPPADPKARLLRMAVIRRDEVLIDRLLVALRR